MKTWKRGLVYRRGTMRRMNRGSYNPRARMRYHRRAGGFLTGKR